ncbi:MAG: GntR family transcriptional regulator [Pseudonocardia sp.]|nr:GntR family transcriptional regulator [Pseudonocardia sp.]
MRAPRSGEHELVADYEGSRHTVRDAQRRLRDEGILDSGRGRGTRVRKPRIEQPLGALGRVHRDASRNSERRCHGDRRSGPQSMKL